LRNLVGKNVSALIELVSSKAKSKDERNYEQFVNHVNQHVNDFADRYYWLQKSCNNLQSTLYRPENCLEKIFYCLKHISKYEPMHDDPIIHLWMLQNALTTFTQIVHHALYLFFYKNYCQGVILKQFSQQY
jgi:hypothetical protein